MSNAHGQNGPLLHAIEESRRTEDAFDAIIESCLAKGPRIVRGSSASLEAALAKLEAECAEHPSIKWCDRPEDMEDAS